MRSICINQNAVQVIALEQMWRQCLWELAISYVERNFVCESDNLLKVFSNKNEP